ncbi:MAG: hypothetical protein DRH12_04750 [Deltaproteobacteria bacterium]|nr:MAG: hypothetical protein DRH12_04750 [Deltaproteobacteria bacterium]
MVGMVDTKMRERKFLADSMLGKLAKWLRIMGYDTHYQSRYSPGQIERLVKADRILITRKRQLVAMVPAAVLLFSDRVGEQINELNARGLFSPSAKPFSRCIRCNTLLVRPGKDILPYCVPDYVKYESGDLISQCPTCGRCYWPGTHRENMEKQLHSWGVRLDHAPPYS